ncbi:sensor histidine kinase [Agromyces protaetiae]|uniref:Sensor histidine kinase n=1 Tax=Agromyces protaetiae TaxID=2509455 RepID=A0A4P6FCW8_9MICO|nr:sensor histidine kinase [Agromyces protaetiae]QAY72199.1 sensor histidine kinase [Agromyces protaetiae]
MLNRRWWDVAAIAIVVVSVAFVLVDMPFGPQDWGVWVVAAVFLLAYFAYLRRHLVEDGDQRHYFPAVTLLAVIVAVGCFFDPSFATMQTFAYPYVWVTTESKRRAIIGNVIVAVVVAIGYGLHFGPSGYLAAAGIAALSLAFSLALGLWISRIAEYSEERGRLLAELQAAQGELATAHREAGVMQERARLAREIHDTIAQSLTGLVMVAQRTGNRLAHVAGDEAEAARGDVSLIEDMARDALTEARGLVASLAPVDVETSLADALRRVASGFARETGIEVEVAASGPRLDPELEVVLLRSAQEALANVRKHADASHAWIDVDVGPDAATLRVRDDGVGPGDARIGERGFGLAGVRDRVALVGGRVAFGAAGDGGGTVLEVEVPVADVTGVDP